MLYKWYKGTGGGSGNSTMFQYWSDEIKDKYDVIVEEYDHVNVKERPSTPINNYSKEKYLTVFLLRNKEKDYILGLKYNPLSLSVGEAGIGDIDDTTIIQITPRSIPEWSRAELSTQEEATSLLANEFSLVHEMDKIRTYDMTSIEK